VPDKFTLDFDQLDVSVIQFADDFRAPVLVEFAELLGKIDRFHFPSGRGICAML
jgi:hypothetical protein